MFSTGLLILLLYFFIITKTIIEISSTINIAKKITIDFRNLLIE